MRMLVPIACSLSCPVAFAWNAKKCVFVLRPVATFYTLLCCVTLADCLLLGDAARLQVSQVPPRGPRTHRAASDRGIHVYGPEKHPEGLGVLHGELRFWLFVPRFGQVNANPRK